MADWYFRGGPKKSNLKTCPACRNLVRADEEFCPMCAKRLRPKSRLRGAVSEFLASPNFVTKALIGLIGLVFVLNLIADMFLPAKYRGEGGSGFNLLAANWLTYVRMGSDFHVLVGIDHQYWRLLTSCFLHFGIIHIGFNCWCLWDLGRLAERLWGGKQVFATFVLTGFAGGLASYGWYYLIYGPANSAGASGAICGILGLALGAYFRNKYHVGEQLGSYLLRWAAYILVFGLLAGADNAAHVGGMVAGIGLGYVLPPTRNSKNPAFEMQIWNAAAILSLVLLLVAAGFAIAFFAQHSADDTYRMVESAIRQYARIG